MTAIVRRVLLLLTPPLLSLWAIFSLPLDAVSQALILAATSGAFAFVVLFAALAPWWRSAEGRHMMALTVGLTALGASSLIRRAWGEWPAYDETVTAIYALLAWELWRRVALLVKAQIQKRRSDYDEVISLPTEE